MKKPFEWALSTILLISFACAAQADMPYPRAPEGIDVRRYEAYCRLQSRDDLPMNYRGSDIWKYSSDPSGDGGTTTTRGSYTA